MRQWRTNSFHFIWIHPLISTFQEDTEIVSLTTFQFILYPIQHSCVAGYTNVEKFKGTPRQRARGLVALAGTIARTAFPVFRKYVLPAAKKLWKDSLEVALPERGKVIAGRSSIKKTNKRKAKKTVRAARRRDMEEKQSREARMEPGH